MITAVVLPVTAGPHTCRKKRTAVPAVSHQDAVLLHLLQFEGGSTRHMQTVSAAHSNCVSTCYGARNRVKCAARRLQFTSQNRVQHVL